MVLEDTTIITSGNLACAVFIGDGSVLRMNNGNTLSNDAPGFNCSTLSVYRNSTARIRGLGNIFTNASGFALDVEMVSSVRIDGDFQATINGNVESFNLSTIDLRKVVVNGNIFADSLTANVRLRAQTGDANAVVINGNVFPGSDSAVSIRLNGGVLINGNIDCTNGANVTQGFTNFGTGMSYGYVNC